MRELLFGCILTMLPNHALAGDCSVLPKPKMTLRLTLDGVPPVAADEIRSVVEQVWSDEGLTFSWAPAEVGPDAWAGIDAWIAVVDRQRKSRPTRVLGDVQFHDDTPSRLVRVYADAVGAWLSDDARRFRAASQSRDPRSHDVVLARALGDVAAHELGHFVLGVRTHVPAGLMQVQFNRPPDAIGGAGLRLDESNRRLLRSRLLARADCH